jgi:hypothetical protein
VSASLLRFGSTFIKKFGARVLRVTLKCANYYYIARFKSKCLRALVSLVITAWRMAPSGSFYEDLRSPLLADSMSRVIMFYSVLMLCSSCLESSIGLYFAKLGSVARERELFVMML